MPELPEVETIARDLDAYLRRRVISDLELMNSPKTLHAPFALFKKKTLGQKVQRVFRRAKMLVVDLGTQYMVFHLKMTGQLIFVSKKTIIAGGHSIRSTGIDVPNRFTRFVIKFKDGSALYFNDIRKFGWIKLQSPEEFDTTQSQVGVEPFDTKLTFKLFKTFIERRPRTTIKALLLDQKLIAGIGNIYADEILFRAGVNPERRVNTLSEAEAKKIFRSIPIILRLSIKQRGTTFSNFLDPDGLRGNFVPFLKVYGRGSQKCKVCGRKIEKSRVAGRGTHYCPHCQS